MDEFESCTLDDVPMLAMSLKAGENILFSYSVDREMAFTVYIGRDFSVIGNLSFGGNPQGRYVVGLLFKGFFHFDLSKKQFPDYVGEKLGLNEKDAVVTAKLLTAISVELQKKE